MLTVKKKKCYVLNLAFISSGQPPPPFDPNFPATWPQAMSEDTSSQDSSRRNMLKWESDEDLGPNATISPILYCNLVHPELKQQYPGLYYKYMTLLSFEYLKLILLFLNCH